MSFSILIQRNESPLNKIGKTLSTLSTINGELRNESEIMNPEILVEVPITTLASANYLTISTFNRKYFIEEIESIRTDLAVIRAHVDVLETYAQKIKSNTAVILRQENDFNMLLNDGVFKCQQNPRIYLRDFPSGLGQWNYILIAEGA